MNFKTCESRLHHLTRASLAGSLAFLLVVGLSLLLSRFRALAQPVPEANEAILNVEKSVNTDVAAPGDTLTYTIRIWNTGDEGASAWLTDTLQSQLTYVTDSLTTTASGATFGFENGIITWSHPNLVQAWITFNVEISPNIAYAEIVNTAQVTGAGQLVESSAQTTAIAEIGDLDNQDTRKTITPQGQVEPGDVLTYTITLSNSSDAQVPGVQVIDRLPSALSLYSDSITYTKGNHIVQDDVITWTLDISGDKDSAVLSFNVSVLPYEDWITNTAILPYEGWITNTADVSAPGIQPFKRTAEAHFYQGQPQLEASKSVYPSWHRPGDYLTYTVRIQNIGDDDAETVRMTDQLPSLVTYVTDSLTATMGTFGEAGGVITWNATLGPAGTLLLPEGGEAVITFTVRILPELTENTIFTNTAEITGAGSLVLAQVPATVLYRSYIYLPLVFKRYPPVPYTPILHAIDNPDQGFNDYTVRWSHDHDDVSVISYTLQEATNAGFTGAVNNYSVSHTGTENELGFTDKPDGTYYYRVRGHNAYGPGLWSNVDSVTIFTIYYDDFTDENSGWPIDRGRIKDKSGEVHGYWYVGYYDNNYQLFVEDATCRTCDWFVQPAALAPYSPPSDKYCVDTNVRFADAHYWSNMGVIFGANEWNTQFYALCLSRDSDDVRLGWFIIRQDDYSPGGFGCAKPDASYAGGGDRTGTSREGWNRIQISVDGEWIHVYLGGYDKGWFWIGGLKDMTRVGVVGGDGEIPPTDIRYDYYRVLPNASCTP